MNLDPKLVDHLTVPVDVQNYVRIVKRAHENSPLGMGYGETRFSSPTNAFKLLYLARDSRTSIAETIIRDRFLGTQKRQVLRDEFDLWSIAEIKKAEALNLLDLREEGAHILGVATDAVRAQSQLKGRRLSQQLWQQTLLDGILYMSRITNRECVAVYERAVAKLEADIPAIELPRLGSLLGDITALRIEIV